MALRPKVIYAGQIDETDLVNYPQGKAQNDLVEGDGIGTPLEKQLVNELFGFQQALLSDTGITPNNTPETAVSSQYVSAIQVLADRSRCVYAAKDLGVSRSGTVDVDTALAAAEAKLVADFGGGALFFHPGRYRLNAGFPKDPRVDWLAVPGTATVALNDAGSTENVLNLTSGTYSRELQIFGLDFEGDIAQGGVVFRGGAGMQVLVRFSHCRVNKSSSLLNGKIVFANGSGSRFAFEKCDLASTLTAAASFDCPYLELLGGDVTMAPAAAADLIAGGNLGMLIEGVTFHQVSTLGGISFIAPNGGDARIYNNTFDVDDSSAGDSTHAVSVNSFTRLFTRGNSWGDAIAYDLVSTSAPGSQVETFHLAEDVSAGPVVVVVGAGSAFIRCSGASAPVLELSDPVDPDQELTICVANTHGSGTWGALNIVGVGGSVSLFFAQSSSYPAIAAGDAAMIRFRTMVTQSGQRYWCQTSTALTLT